MDFVTWVESKQFERLIPKEVLDLVPKIKAKGKELTDWMRKAKNEDDLEHYNLSSLIVFMPIYHLKQDQRTWRKFMSILWSEIQRIK